MKDFQNDIDKLVSKILNEEIDSKVRKIMETKSEWKEIEMDENLKGGQSKIDVAEPKGKITAADFKKLRDAKSHKKEVEEFYYSDDSDFEEAEELSKNEPTYVGRGLADNKIKNTIKNKMFGSFDDEHGWFDQSDREHTGDFDFDYDEEEFEDFPSLMSKHGKNQRWFAPNDGEKYFNQYQQKFGGKPFRVRMVKGLEETHKFEGKKSNKSEVEENIFKKMFGKKEDPEVAREKDRKENPYLGNLGYDYDDIRGWHYVGPGQGRFDKDSEDGEIEEGMYGSFDDEHGWYDKDDRQHTGDFDFDFDEEEFSDFDSLMNKHGKNQRWFGKDGKMYFDKYQEKFGGKPFRVRTRKNEMGENEVEEGNAFSGKRAQAIENGEDTFEVDGKTYPVKESKRTNSVKEKVIFTESELINFIERLVEAEKVVDKGFKTAMTATEKENRNAMKQVAAKMKDYMKNMGTEYEENPQSFPKGNKIMSREDFGKEVSDDKKNAYDASDAVDEYIDAFAYPGQTNLVFDEIKPDDTKIEKYLKGHSTTGNAQVDEDGNALGNVVPSEVGEKFYKNYKENLYGAEQMNASYKRQPAPVDIAGSEKSNGNLKSLKASQQIFNKLEESVENKKVISEMEKMKNLIGYNRKTQ